MELIPRVSHVHYQWPIPLILWLPKENLQCSFRKPE